MRARIVQILLALLCVVTFQRGSIAQVIIADQGYHEALNAAVPGLVDASGMMNTAHPDLATIDSLSLTVWTSASSLSLNGLDYFLAVRHLGIYVMSITGTGVSSTIPDLPPTVEVLKITGHGSVDIDGLPLVLEELVVHASPGHMPLSVTLVSTPTSIAALRVYQNSMIDWSGAVNVGQVHVHDFNSWPLQDLVLPAMAAGTVDLWNITVHDLDLSSITTEVLFTHDSSVEGLVSWPAGASSMYLDLGWTTLQSWPSTLDTLWLSYAGGCIPPLPDGLRSLEFQFDFECLPNWPTNLDSVAILTGIEFQYENTVTYCSVLNSECPGAYPALAGVVRMDLNNNGTVDADEPIVPSSTVNIAPGGQSTGCLADGSWQIGVPPGEHTITAASAYPYAVSVSPVSHAGSVPAMGDVDLNNDFAVAVLSDIQDLRVHVYADPARPGFDNQVHLHCENYGTTPVDAELTLAFDADQTWLSSSVAPTSTSSNTATWNFPAMPIGAVQHIVVELNTAASVPLGTDITHTLTADPITTDETPSDNTYTFNDSVVGSYDPNDKLLSPAVLTPDEVALGETPIEYIIRFQNTGTYLAERVVILDTLSNDLQWESMRFIASSHDQHWYIVDGVLYVVYSEIMLPDSNANEAASHGFFKFSMLPKTDLVNGSTIENIAHIVFDFNAPIVTPPAVFTVDIGAGVEAGSTTTELRILPNPAHDRIQLIVDDATVLPYRILDLLGQEVQRGAAQPNAWIDVQALDNGSYLLEVTNAGVPTSLRFMKQ